MREADGPVDFPLSLCGEAAPAFIIRQSTSSPAHAWFRHPQYLGAPALV